MLLIIDKAKSNTLRDIYAESVAFFYSNKTEH